MTTTKDKNGLYRAMMAEMQKAAPKMERKHQEEAAKRADIERRVQGCQQAIEQRRQEMAAQIQEANKAAEERYQKQYQDLQTAVASGSTEALAAALAAMTGKRQAQA